MKSKKKAKELVENFDSQWMIYPKGTRRTLKAKQCALIAVDEIIESNPRKPYDYNNTLFYWENVRQEIEKL